MANAIQSEKRKRINNIVRKCIYKLINMLKIKNENKMLLTLNKGYKKINCEYLLNENR